MNLVLVFLGGDDCRTIDLFGLTISLCLRYYTDDGISAKLDALSSFGAASEYLLYGLEVDGTLILLSRQFTLVNS